jgi:hypothetical protein
MRDIFLVYLVLAFLGLFMIVIALLATVNHNSSIARIAIEQADLLSNSTLIRE